MATILERQLKHVAGVLILLLIIMINDGKGADLYSNSFISPNSANEELEHSDGPNLNDFTLAPSEEIQLSSPTSEILSTSSYREKVKRSADPILSKTSGLDNLIQSYKNVEESLDGNGVELSGRIPPNIRPSKTDKSWGHFGHQVEQTVLSGEGPGAPQGRALPLQEPRHPVDDFTTIRPTATTHTPTIATSLPHPGKARQANPDIQDIITGIVKLLNGNVNVQANTAPVMNGRPLRPLSTRINNRGPPRITDVPALPPDFDVPAPPLPPPPLGQMAPPVSPTRMPTPYPFDLPPQNTSPLRPPFEGSKRPGFYRPVTIPPWNTLRKKTPPPQRRPNNPHVPPQYKPMVEDIISITSEKPIEDVLTDVGGTQLLQPNHRDEDDSNKTESDDGATTVKPSAIKFEKKKEKNSSKMQKHSTQSSSAIKASSSTSSSSVIINSTNSDLVISTSSTSITSNYSAPINATPSTSEFLTPTATVTNSTIVTDSSLIVENETTPVLESSIQDVLQTLRQDLLSSSASTTPTESLPKIPTTTSSSLFAEGTMGIDLQTSNAVLPDNKTSSQGFPYFPYRPRPGIVLDDTEYKPGGSKRQPIVTRPPIGQLGDIFDITVSAIQGPGGSAPGQGKPYVIPVDIESIHGAHGEDVITSPVGDEGFVSIDGKRTYLNLFGEEASSPSTSSAPVIKPSAASNNQVSGTGYAVVDQKPKPNHNPGSVKATTQRRPIYGRPRPNQPPVRIDTCIVGDDSTCDGSQHEVCRTEAGVSACHCRPGHARRKHRDPCRKIVSVLLSLRVDRLYDRRVIWANELNDRTSESYQQLSYEAERALESAMSMTPFSDEFLAAKVNAIYQGERSAGQAGVFVNLTLQLDENADTARPTVKGDIQKHLLGVIQRRSNNVGNSALWVDSPPGSVSHLQDLDECSSPEFHDCHALAKCINVFGGFKCECDEGYKDQWADSKHRAGRHCEQCSPQHCNNRGECKYQNGQEVCLCSGNYYGNQCELDGEVLGVAIGASVAAVIIIGLTLVCLVMWSRRWNREQKAAVGSPVFGYMATASNTVKAPVVGAPPYQLTLEDRLRWAQIADVMAQANHYAPEPVTAPTRPSSAMFGFHNMSMSGTLQHGTLPPVPLPRLNLQAQMAGRTATVHGMRHFDNSSSSEEEDKADLLGRNFQVPRPKSRSNASIANQSGIYYDVDYDQNEIYKQAGGIPMSTYSMGRPPYYRN